VEHRTDRWRWHSVAVIHRGDTARSATCTGEIYSYRYRIYAPTHPAYERCIGLAWCSICREYSSAIVHGDRNETLWDALADLPTQERERRAHSSLKVLDHLDRLVRRGQWPTQQP
jgi:hypothetical protein